MVIVIAGAVAGSGRMARSGSGVTGGSNCDGGGCDGGESS